MNVINKRRRALNVSDIKNHQAPGADDVVAGAVNIREKNATKSNNENKKYTIITAAYYSVLVVFLCHKLLYSNSCQVK